MSPITTHVLDTAAGRPAAGVPVTLEFFADGVWTKLGAGVTNTDGRLPGLLLDPHALQPGTYRLTFDTAVYFAGRPSFYPYVQITFNLADATQHYHVPLLLSPFGYSTYRGS
jgi:5-hydroxyisourate hydrolase